MKRKIQLALLACILLLAAILSNQAERSGMAMAAPHNQYPDIFSEAHDVSVNQQMLSVSDTAVYKQAYYSLAGSNRWTPITLDGQSYSYKDDWLTRTATYDLPEGILGAGEHYVITYTCTLVTNAWDCHGGRWQLLVIRPAPTLALHYRFDADLADSSGNDRHGTAIGNPESTPGTIGAALRFDGNDAIDVPGFSIEGQEITIAAWARIDSFEHAGLNNPSDADARIISKATGTNEHEHDWMLSTAKSGEHHVFRARVKAGGTTTTLMGTTPLQEGTWYHVAFTYDGASIRLYLDGELEASTPKTGTITTSAAGVRVADNPGASTDRYLQGALDDLRVYASALTQEEVQALSAAGTLPRTDGTATIISVTATSHDGHGPQNTIDNDLSEESRWSASGDGEYVEYAFNQSIVLDELAIACYRGTERQTFFTIATTIDGSAWTTAYEGQSSGTTNEQESYTFPAVSAQRLRLIGHGNNGPYPQWTSITEVSFRRQGFDVVKKQGTYVPPDSGSTDDGGASNDPVPDDGFLTGTCDGRIILYENNFEHRTLGGYASIADFRTDWPGAQTAQRWREAEIVSGDAVNPSNTLKLTYPYYDNKVSRYYCWSNNIGLYFDEPPTCKECPRWYKSGTEWVCLSKKDADNNYLRFDHEPSCTECPTQYATAWGISPSSAGGTWKVDLPGGSYQELYFSYKIKFGPSFHPGTGGKIPGLCGGTCPGGCVSVTGEEGFSARMMMNYDDLRFYVYYPDKNTACGSSQVWPAETKPEDDGWHTIVQRVVMNSRNNHNGVLEGWYDGKLVSSEQKYNFITGETTNFGIDAIHFSTFYGGSTETVCRADLPQCLIDPNDPTKGIFRYSNGEPINIWVPRKTETIYFDDFVVYYYDSQANVPKGRVKSPTDRIEVPPPPGNPQQSICS